MNANPLHCQKGLASLLMHLLTLRLMISRELTYEGDGVSLTFLGLLLYNPFVLLVEWKMVSTLGILLHEDIPGWVRHILNVDS